MRPIFLRSMKYPSERSLCTVPAAATGEQICRLEISVTLWWRIMYDCLLQPSSHAQLFAGNNFAAGGVQNINYTHAVASVFNIYRHYREDSELLS